MDVGIDIYSVPLGIKKQKKAYILNSSFSLEYEPLYKNSDTFLKSSLENRSCQENSELHHDVINFEADINSYRIDALPFSHEIL